MEELDKIVYTHIIRDYLHNKYKISNQRITTLDVDNI